MRRGQAVFLSLLAALFFPVVPAAAAPAVKVQPSKTGVKLYVGGQLIAAFRTPNGSLSPEGRANLAAERLRTLLLGDDLGREAVEVRDRGENSAVYLGGMLLMIATPEEAKERKEKPRATAERWAVNLKAALGPGKKVAAKNGEKATRPAKSAKTTPARKSSRKATLAADPAVTVPLEETREVVLRGTAEGPITVRTEGDAVLAQPVEGKAAVEVRGVSVGSAVVRVVRGGVETGFTVTVKKYAGRVSSVPEASVTGSVAPVSLVRKVAAERALEGVERQPGASVKISGPAEGARAIGRGDSVEVSYPVTISGEGLLTNKTTARVRVANIVLPRQEAGTLLYSNDPESVREYGTLYEGLVDHRAPVRLLFHHQNRMGRAFTFQIHLTNPDDAPVDVQVIEADAGPFIDPLQAGHRAAQRYLSAVAEDVGYVTRIPARSSRLVYVARMPHLDTVSGIYNFRVVSGGSLVAQIRALTEISAPELREDLVEVASSEPHTYPAPTKDLEYKYAVGDRWTFVHMGRQAITGRRVNRKLFGNYGVMYDINVDLSNPTDEEKTVRIVLAPEAGWARGAFLIDGKLIEAPQVAPPSEAVLWSVKLAPQQRRKVRIQGIPAGGSAYPVSLVVRS